MWGFETKADQRAYVRGLRKGMTEEERAEKSRLLCMNLLCLPELKKAEIILSYMPLPEEANIEAVNRSLRRRGKCVCFPLTQETGVMGAYEPGSGDGFEIKHYGIREPVLPGSREILPEEIDLVLVPCVAFDDDLMRLGQGAGYYDRYLPRCKKAVKIAAAFETQRLERVICNEQDIPMDVAVTEKGVYRR